MREKPQHATITLAHSYPAPVERVYSEFADPVARARWSHPSDDVLIYAATDFRERGRDIFRCGRGSNPNVHGETTYHLIVPNRQVVSSETLDVDGQRLAISITTLDFEPTEKGTEVKVIVQMVSLVGPGMIAGYEAGNKSALDNLARHLGGNI